MGLETVEIVMDAEDHFGIDVPDEVASGIITVADFQKVIVDLLVQKGSERSAQLENRVFADLARITARVTGIDPSAIRPDSRWVGDLTKYG